MIRSIISRWLVRFRQPRHLAERAFQVPWWRERVDGRARRLAPREYIAPESPPPPQMRGRDPLKTARVPGRWTWLALLGWTGLAALRGWRLWRRTGETVPGEPRSPADDGPSWW